MGKDNPAIYEGSICHLRQGIKEGVKACFF
jgi:hypothetical protein